MKTQHTSEPWRVGDAGKTVFGPPCGIPPVIVANCDYQQTRLDGSKRANAARIVACVNACAGLSDPAADLAALREALQHCVEWMEGQMDEAQHMDHMLDGHDEDQCCLCAARAALARVERGQK